MEWLSKLVNVLKIPLKILLPAAWLFSGLMTLLPAEVLEKFSLLDWKNENGFVFGLLFLITSCLIAIYVIYFAKEKLSDVIFQEYPNWTIRAWQLLFRCTILPDIRKCLTTVSHLFRHFYQNSISTAEESS